jgi:hypothetical protein
MGRRNKRQISVQVCLVDTEIQTLGCHVEDIEKGSLAIDDMSPFMSLSI